MIEEWRDVIGYEGLYQVSNFGRVKSLDKLNIRGFKVNGKILKPNKHSNGYLKINLYINCKRKTFTVHRLVAEAFIPNLENKPQINHKDEDKINNNFDNLEWVTQKENNNYGTRNIRASKSNSKPIKVIYQDDTYEYWESSKAFAKEFGISQSSICEVLHGKWKACFGIRFEYAKEET